MKKEKVMEKIMEHIDALGSASEIYSWGSCIYAIMEEDNTLYRFHPYRNKYFVSHCGPEKGCVFTKEEEYEI